MLRQMASKDVISDTVWFSDRDAPNEMLSKMPQCMSSESSCFLRSMYHSKFSQSALTSVRPLLSSFSVIFVSGRVLVHWSKLFLLYWILKVCFENFNTLEWKISWLLSVSILSSGKARSHTWISKFEEFEMPLRSVLSNYPVRLTLLWFFCLALKGQQIVVL